MQADISVIIPVYNLEKYIGATLESVLLQQGVTLEVLVVDDCSIDASRSIIEAYAKKYSHIKLLVHEKNKGVGSARNTALRVMSGKTCYFLDGDDILPPNALAPLFMYMQDHNLPFVRGRGATFCQQQWLYHVGSLPDLDVNKYPAAYFVLYLYDSEFLRQNSCYFPEDCFVCEDVAFFSHFFCLLNFEGEIPFVDVITFIYRINHKPLRITAKNAPSLIKNLIVCRKNIEKSPKKHLLATFFEYYFQPVWLHYAYYTLQESSASIIRYLEDCAILLEKLENEVAPILQKQLQGQSDAFWQACRAHDAQKMLEVLKAGNLLQPVSYSFIGIDERRVQCKFWKLIRLSKRFRNFFANVRNAKKLWYIYNLEKKSKNFLSIG